MRSHNAIGVLLTFPQEAQMSPILLLSDWEIPETNRKQNLFSDINAILNFLYFINNSKKSDGIHVYTLTILKITDHL